MTSSLSNRVCLVKRQNYSTGMFVQAVARSVAKPAVAEENSPLTFAEKVLDKVDRKFYSEPNIMKLRAKVDLEQQIAELEQELRQEISRSLRRTEEKLIMLLAATNATHKHLESMRTVHGQAFQ